MINKLSNWYSKHRAYKQTYKELNSLTNHELYDLGFDRGMIKHVAYEATYGSENRRG